MTHFRNRRLQSVPVYQFLAYDYAVILGCMSAGAAAAICVICQTDI